MVMLMLLATAAAAQSVSSSNPTYTIGAYHYPGWKGDAAAWSGRDPWAPIKKFPEREALLGWYDEGDVDVMVRI